MAQDIVNLLRTLVKVRGALTLAPAPAPRPQLAGSRGYKDGGIKQPD